MSEEKENKLKSKTFQVEAQAAQTKYVSLNEYINIHLVNAMSRRNSHGLK